MVAVEDEPSVEEALTGPEVELWRLAFQAEYNQIEKMETWDLVELPKGVNLVGSRCVLRRKRDSEGKVAKYKVRAVAKGFTQKFGIDYMDMFSPTVRPATIRTPLAVAASLGAEIDHRDVKNAYLWYTATGPENLHGTSSVLLRI